MIYLCCYTRLRQETLDALERYAGQDRLSLLHVGRDRCDYGRAIAHAWRRGRSFAVVEHDIVIRPDVVDAFDNCPHDYCAFVYPWTTNIGPALGCTRFRSRLLKQHPDAADALPSLSYRQVDYELIRVELAGRRGLRPHLHLPPVEHLNEAQTLQPQFARLSVDEHLAALGWVRRPDGEYDFVGGAFGPLGVSA